MAAFVNLVTDALPATENRWEEIWLCQEGDPVYQEVAHYCLKGWP